MKNILGNTDNDVINIKLTDALQIYYVNRPRRLDFKFKKYFYNLSNSFLKYILKTNKISFYPLFVL